MRRLEFASGQRQRQALGVGQLRRVALDRLGVQQYLVVTDILVDDQRVTVVRDDRGSYGPTEADAAAVELVRAQRHLGRLRHGGLLQRALRRRQAVVATAAATDTAAATAARKRGHRQVPEQAVLQRRRRRAHGCLAGRVHRAAAVRQPRGEIRQAAVAVQRVVYENNNLSILQDRCFRYNSITHRSGRERVVIEVSPLQ